MNTDSQTVARCSNFLRKQSRRSAKHWRALQRLALGAILGAGFCAPALVSANDTTWNLATSASWNTVGNWTAGVPVDANTTIVRFGGSTSYTATQNVTNNLLVNQIHFTNTGVGETVSIVGSAASRGVQLSGTSPVFDHSAASNVTFDANANIRFNASATLSGNGTGVLTIANLGASSAADLTFTANLSNLATSVNITTFNISNNASARTTTLATTSNVTVGSIANGSATTGNFIKANGGTLTILGAGTYNGSTTINNGTVAISGFNAFGIATSPIQLGNAINTNVGSISYSGANASYTRGFNLGLAGGRLDVTNAATNLSIDTSGISAAGTNSALTKLGAGTLSLNTANSYGGSTTILAGTLVQGNAAAFGTSNLFSITSGALLNVTNSGLAITSGGSLTAGRASAFAADIQGAVSLDTSTLNVAGSAAYGTLTQAGNFALNGGTLQLNLNNITTAGAGVNDLIDITGDLTLGGTIAVNVTPLNGALTSGSYRLFNYTGTLTGGGTNFATPSVAAPGRNTYAYDTSIAGQVNLNVSTAPAGNLTWTGGVNANTWDLQNTINWTGAADNKFYNGDTVNFTDAGLLNNTVNIDGALTAIAVNVSNTTGNYTFGTATGGSLAGITIINKTGAGSLTIQTANTHSGANNINEGTLVVANPAALGSSAGATIVANGAQVQFNGGGTVAEPFTINGTGIAGAGALQNTSGATIIAGTVTVASAASIINNDVVNTLTFDVATGNAFDGSFPLTVNGTGNIDINDPISNSATGGVIKNGTGTLTLAGTAANGTTAGYTVNGGTLQLNKTAAIDAVRGSVTIGNGTDPATIKLLASNQIRDDDPFTINANATFDLNGFSDTVGTLNGTGTITSTAGNISINDGNFAGLITGALSLTKTDPGLLILSGTANTFTAAVRVNNGTLEVVSLADSGPGSNGTGTIQILNSTNAAATFKYSGSGTTITRPISVTGNGSAAGNAILESSGSGPLIINAGVSRLNTGTGLKTFVMSGTNTGLNTISGLIENGAATLNLAKDGLGTWILTGDNAYTGATTISAGILQLGNGGTTGSIATTSGVTNNAALAYNRSDALSVGYAISGTGTVTQQGAGTTTFTGANTYAGGTTVSAGTLQVGTGGTVGTGAVTNNATFDVARTGLTTAAITGTGTTTVTAAGASLTANSVRQAGLTIGAGNAVTVPLNGGDTGVSRVTNLSINATGKLDLKDNDLIVPSGTLTTAQVESLVNAGSFGTAAGITSSLPAVANAITGLGTGQIGNTAWGGSGSYAGQAVSNSDTLVKYTYLGDTDLDGSVTFDDYLIWQDNFNTGTGWTAGHFQYDGGTTSFDDYLVWQTNFGLTLSGSNASSSLGISAVPEPSTWVLGGLSLLGLLGGKLRSRRRNAG